MGCKQQNNSTDLQIISHLPASQPSSSLQEFIIPRHQWLSFLRQPPCLLSVLRKKHSRKTYPFLFYLKRNYPDAKFAIYYQDLIATHPHTDINWIKQHFDLVLSYDYNDAERYGILYYPTPYSSIPVETGIGTEKDLYFLGATKNRFTEIIEAYESCTQNGLKCDFNLVGVPGKQQVYKDDIHYIKSMPYRENLSRASRSKCLLEILQKNAKGYTPRMWEAILLGKKIMTNNPTVRYSPFYDERYVSIFTDTKNSIRISSGPIPISK